ncbi:hypothetical protein ERO13_A13G099515v2 [Gossypium hirsutum]|uniref:Uncharacterized protein n=1 Tax=Gossypium barbadense TaxID=3634 RepID=A0A5J5SXV4_GOSBA|nr:hypothetical protein ES319_A13G114300v1 [Gossypium barbadense]KAG4165901.1 hypothetical protein ERO13_A13G099515v2 [Gossypium hirsutum]
MRPIIFFKILFYFLLVTTVQCIHIFVIVVVSVCNCCDLFPSDLINYLFSFHIQVLYENICCIYYLIFICHIFKSKFIKLLVT